MQLNAFKPYTLHLIYLERESLKCMFHYTFTSRFEHETLGIAAFESPNQQQPAQQQQQKK
jgi:hypothetical protein